MKSQIRKIVLLITPILVILSSLTPVGAGTFTEDFTTTTNRSASTTAHWDTSAGELKLWPYGLLGETSLTPQSKYALSLVGDYAYLAPGASKLTIIDLSDPANPDSVGTYDTPGTTKSIAVAGDYAYLAQGTDGLLILDVSAPANPLVAGTYNTPSFGVDDIEIDGNHLYTAGGSAGLYVLDISNPASPDSIGAYDRTAIELAVNNGYAYVKTSSDKLTVLDISTPANPDSVGNVNNTLSHPVAGYVNAGWAADDYLLLWGNDNALFSAGPTPSELTGLPIPGFEFDLSLVTPNAALVATSEGLQTISFSEDAGWPVATLAATVAVVDSVTTEGWVLGLAANEQMACVMTYGGGVYTIASGGAPEQAWLGLDNNVGQSSLIPGITSLTARVRLASTETEGISWKLNNLAWTPDNVWQPFSSGYIRWETTHSVAPPYGPGVDHINPTVSSLTIEWLYHGAEISSVVDIPNDQGKQVRVQWNRSGHDFVGDSQQIVEYAVYRQIDPNLPTQAGSSAKSLTGLSSVARENVLTMQAAGWHYLTSVPVLAEDIYAVVVPTAADSTLAGTYNSTFRVTALTATPGVFFHSAPDSGYSVDNLAPSVPSGFTVTFNTDGGNTLSWEDSSNADFQSFRIYRSSVPDFSPTSENLVHSTKTAFWVDSESTSGTVHYKVTAIDLSGNESDPAEIQSVSDVTGDTIPVRTALLAAYPNPFNPTTNLSFELAAPAYTRLKIFDAAGRLVTTLVDEQRSSGRHEVVWNGQNSAGLAVASGVYLYRFEAGDVVQTKRMMLVK